MKVSQQIKELFKMLSPIEQQELLSELSSDNINCSPKESNVSSWPYCYGVNFVKNGKYKGRQRYKCKACNRNFSSHTGTAFQGIKKLDKIDRYKSIMFDEGFISLEKIIAVHLKQVE